MLAYERKFNKANEDGSLEHFRKLAQIFVCLIEKTDASDSADLKNVRGWFLVPGNERPKKLEECLEEKRPVRLIPGLGEKK